MCPDRQDIAHGQVDQVNTTLWKYNRLTICEECAFINKPKSDKSIVILVLLTQKDNESIRLSTESKRISCDFSIESRLVSTTVLNGSSSVLNEAVEISTWVSTYSCISSSVKDPSVIFLTKAKRRVIKFGKDAEVVFMRKKVTGPKLNKLRLLQNLSVSAEILPWSTLGAFFRISR